MVRLRVHHRKHLKHPLQYFNSDMVRLRVGMQPGGLFGEIFQFRHGAIKSLMVTSNGDKVPNFNSDMVRLRGKKKRENTISLQYFNSDMVRLRAKFAYAICNCIGGFQFRHGAIKRIVCMALSYFFIKFQFRHGAIKSRSKPI